MRSKRFYGWVNIAVLFFIAVLPMVLVSNYYSYYQVPVSQELGVSFTAFSTSNVFSTIAGMLFSALLATKLAQGNTRLYMFACALVSAAAIFAQSYITQIWHLYITFFIANFAFNGITYTAINFIISQWFIDKKGMVTSVVLSGLGVGGLIFSVPLSKILETYGWRAGWRLTALVLVITAVLILLFIRKSPEEMGQEAYVDKKKTSDSSGGNTQAESAGWEGMSKAEAVKTVSFWFFVVLMICAGMTAAGVVTQIPSFFIENSLDHAALMAVYSLATIFGTLILGPVLDKAGVSVGGIIGSAIASAALIFLILVPRMGKPAAYLSMIIFPFGAPIANLLPPLLVGKVFGYKDFAGIFGLGNIAFMVGCMIGPVMATGIHDKTGSFIPAWAVFAAVFLLIAICTILSVNGAKNQKKRGGKAL